MYSTLLLVVMFGWCLEGGSATWTDKLLRGAKISSAELNSIGMAAAVRAEKAKRQSVQARAQSDACYCATGKDYSAPCPVGWTVHKDGAECLAPAGYKGYCDVNQTFLLGDAGDKMEAESTCGMCWPCLDACDRDWTAPCPQGYTPQDIPFDKFSAMQFPECAGDSDTKCQYMETFTSTEQNKNVSGYRLRCLGLLGCAYMPQVWSLPQCMADHRQGHMCCAEVVCKEDQLPTLDGFQGLDRCDATAIRCGVQRVFLCR